MNIGNTVLEQLAPGVLLDTGTPSIEYGEQYFRKYALYAQTSMGMALDSFRHGYAEAFMQEGRILDFGCGWGRNVRGSEGWEGHDIMPQVAEGLGGKFVADPKIELYDGICFFDSLEHLRDPLATLRRVSPGCRVIVSMPTWPSSRPMDEIAEWRHWRPGEHLLYVTTAGIANLAELAGFLVADTNTVETALGRRDITTFCMVKQ